MKRALSLLVLTAALAAGPLAAQNAGGLIGHVVDATNERALRGVEVRLDAGRFNAITDSAGDYRFRGIPAGPHSLDVLFPGYRPSHRDGVRISGGEVIRADVRMAPVAVQLPEITAVGIQDPVLDPLATETSQKITAEDFRRLPVTTLSDALSLQAGVVGESYRGGRPGQAAFVLDGLGLKDQLDASTGSTGIKIPPDIITEASLVTNGFSARYGQAISGLINVTTRDGGDKWHGRFAYETDRPMSGGADIGIDRLVLQGDGPLFGRVKAVGVLDIAGQLDGDPANAPAPTNPLDPRTTTPEPLPHNSSETYTAGGKLTIPIGDRLITRLFGISTFDQRYLFDPAYKYDPAYGPGSRTVGSLYSAHLQLLPSAGDRTPFLGDLRIGYFDRNFLRGAVDQPDYKFGAFTGKRLTIRGEDLAKAQDTVSTRGIVSGFDVPQFSYNTPWGVPAFFIGTSPSGEIAWNQFTELRTQLDMSLSAGSHADINFGGMYAAQTVKTFQRVFASLPVGTVVPTYLPVGGTVPPPTASNFTPVISGLYAEAQAKASDLAITAGVRYDGFSPGGDFHNNTLGARSSINPRVAVSTSIKGANIVASVGKFSQPPDLQYLVNSAFDDTLRTGRFRQGNPNLGFESSTQFEFSARVRLRPQSSLKVNVFDKRLEGLVSSVPINVNPDSSIFLNADVGEVIGAEVIFERERHDGWGARAVATFQHAEATVTSAFELNRLPTIDPVTHDTLPAGRNQFPLDFDRRLSLIGVADGELSANAGPRIFGVRPLSSLVMAVVGRWASGLPYTRTTTFGDTLTGPINGERLPATSSIDLLIRKPIKFGRYNGGIYLDIRNLANTANQNSVRRDTGTPYPADSTITKLATAAYTANPGPIPYESPRYRSAADLNHDGVISGQSELMPLYIAAAKDYTQPIFIFGPPRIVRFGMEIVF